ncbi:pyridoxamine 5'-phosphate oxidase family protein [Nocardioides agariphilus]|jgi:nitroimidazol reductase NimA-like FMN-containing flavoprotein (pyridoxamine 5'-phosphate oxidase superfamily)|uniref:Pyridoxamine 5'-phosphate oxidase family protein n=1 Tax=Nocardioides agariphilus TaxID=433664 RepID=A0A930YHM0_9ACTN|nr:pyridoxamine 5'-phosphate oxidase family protein [Nocardioides agariphilus]MBF4767143.1 pyridoxamine 5'-phosphate oxidase family protein [Nocardioides agariphilus]
MAALHELRYSECQALLRAGILGRLAVVAPDGPHVVPVNYSVTNDAVIIATTPDGLLARHGPGTRVAFEADHVDHGYEHGWSVMVRGTLAVLDDATEIARIRATWAPRPWASGSRSLLLKLPLTELSGRRLGSGWDPMSELPVPRA